ncbi:MAG: restriction endonuclease subunit S [Eggerthellaceae bacterium]|nr:restriction endonuclease subunit S [Eggerthellaceae bacterium]
MERYEAYKDSGVEWIGEIPEEWKLKRLRLLGATRSGMGNKKPDDFGTGKPFLSYKDVYSRESFCDATGLVESTEDDRSKFSVERGDAFFTGSSETIEELGFSSVCLSTVPDATFNGFTIRFRPIGEDIWPEYAAYLFRSDVFRGYLRQRDNSITRANLSQQVLGDAVAVLPPVYEQQAIADYLDAKTAEIDALVADCEREVELLQEYRKVVISEAVTKGLDPEAPMKDSGIEWIGEIPEEWDTIRLGEISYIRARLGWRALKADEYVDEGYPMYSAFNIVNEKFVTEPVNYITEFRYMESPEIMMAVGDIMLVKDGAGVGKCAVVRELDGPCTVNGSIALITPEETQDSRYLYYFFESNAFQHFSRMLMGGMGVPHLFQRDIKLMRVIQPDLNTQTLIADYLDVKTAEIDVLIDAKQQMADKLWEYRRSLISEVVTGKFKVPGVN